MATLEERFGALEAQLAAGLSQLRGDPQAGLLRRIYPPTPVGTMVPFVGFVPPEQWVFCDGLLVDQAGKFATLFDVLNDQVGLCTVSGSTFTRANHGLMSGQIIWFEQVNAVTGVSPNTTYTVSATNLTANSFEVAGQVVSGTGDVTLYRSLTGVSGSQFYLPNSQYMSAYWDPGQPLGVSQGSNSVMLTAAQLPDHLHTVNDALHSHNQIVTFPADPGGTGSTVPTYLDGDTASTTGQPQVKSIDWEPFRQEVTTEMNFTNVTVGYNQRPAPGYQMPVSIVPRSLNLPWIVRY